jgi:hypothetical protein
MSDLEVITYILGGLDFEFDPLVTSLTTITKSLTLEDVYGHYLHEVRLEHNSSSIDLWILQITTYLLHADIKGTPSSMTNNSIAFFFTQPTVCPATTAIQY